VALTQGFADTRQLSILGELDVIPTLETAKPAAIVDLPSLQLSEYVRTGAIPAADGWWLSLRPDADPTAVAEGLATASPPLEVTAVRSEAIQARTSDPFQAGVTGVLGLVAGAALLFAVVGLAISLWYTVSSRQGEFAVARALGLARRQLLGWLAIESGFLIVVGVVGGLVVGVVLAWVVMPSITLTTEGRPPIPPPVAAIAWDLVVVLVVSGVVAFGLSVLAARRSIRAVRVAAVLRAAEVDR
jgi:putative ABC transport system permease protein